MNAWDTRARELASLSEILATCTCCTVTMGCSTKKLLGLVPSLKAESAVLVAVTEDKASPVARPCSLVLKVKIERQADGFNLLAAMRSLTDVGAQPAQDGRLHRADMHHR
jgi:D-arabinose 5-phosphate isomerase GutQ